MKAQKTVQVLVTYTFKHVNRVCFTILSSNGEDKYNTCFDNGKAACDCPSTSKKGCYHVNQLRPRYDAIMAKREAARTREQALAAAREASKDELARIEAETLASIAAEQAQPGRPRSEMARIADVMDAPVSKASTFETLKGKHDVRSTSVHRQQAPLQRQGFSLFR